jgi:Cys-rich repeat protein
VLSTGLTRRLAGVRMISAVGASRSALGLASWAFLVAMVAGEIHCTMSDTGTIDFMTGKTGKDPRDQPKPCSGHGECAPPTPYCDAVSATCIECLADPNCAGAKPFCGPRGACVECMGDPGCEKGKPFCDLERYACAECLIDAHCEPTKVCDIANQRCVPSCTDSSTCDPMKPYCDAARRLCVQCLTDANCADVKKPACGQFGACAECTTNTHCSADRPFCDRADDKCVGCTSDLDCPAGRRCDGMRRCAG